MAYLSERVSYIKGLMEGMNLDTATNEGKLFKAIIDVKKRCETIRNTREMTGRYSAFRMCR
jgi:hypothetical protein